MWETVLGAISAAASNPLALAAYAFALTALVVLGWRERRYRETLKRIDSIPEAERSTVIARDIGEPVPPSMSANQYLEYKRQQNRLLLAGIVIVVLAVVGVIALVVRPPLPIHSDTADASAVSSAKPVAPASSGATFSQSPVIGTVNGSATINYH